MTTSPTLLLTSRNTTDAPTNTTQLIAGNEWTFFIGRFIAPANRRLTGYFAGGLIQSTQSTTSSTPTPNSESIGFRNASGATGFLNGDIAELWRTDTDIQPDGAAINSDLVRQLAWRGPFSVPHVAAAIQQYFSFFESPNPTREEIGDVRFQRYPLTWTNRGTGEPTSADHPPLWPDYSVLNPRSNLFTV